MTFSPNPLVSSPQLGLALVGYRGTGKSTVGRLLAERIGRPFADADRVLEARLGRPIAEFFAQNGEAAFRDEEEATLRDLLARDPGAVVATGGGVILRESNRLALRRFGFVAWLKADPATLAARLRLDPADRPALTSLGLIDEIASVLQARTPLYQEVAHAVVETDGRSPEQVADEIREQWSCWCSAPLRVAGA